METHDVVVTLTEEMLGMVAANPDLVRDFLASRRPEGIDESEIDAITVDEEMQKGMTVFPRTADGKPFLWDYQIKGAFKDFCGMLRRVKGTESEKLAAHKKVIDGLIFTYPRQIVIDTHGAPFGTCERPLRAATAQGERVALARSETVPAGTTFAFTVKLLKDALYPALVEWLDYTEDRGWGQWRNSGKGRGTYTIAEHVTKPVIE